MNLRKNGKTVHKLGLIRNRLFGKAVHTHSVFSTDSDGFENIAPYVFDENTRKSVEAAHLGAERWRSEADKLRLNMC